MANAFEKMMENSNNNTPSTSSGSGGRPMHKYWAGYEKVIEKNKPAAKCLKCGKVFSNTAEARMKSHR